MDEIWKKISGFSAYEVSNRGRVRSYKPANGIGGLIAEPRFLKPAIAKGYFRIGIRRDEDNKKMQRHVHILVGMMFIPNPKNKPLLDHIDRNPLNNNASNLRWVTIQENQWNSRVSRTSKTGIKGIREAVYKGIHYWQCSWKEGGKKKSRFFKTKEEALNYRKEQVGRHYDSSLYHWIKDPL